MGIIDCINNACSRANASADRAEQSAKIAEGLLSNSSFKGDYIAGAYNLNDTVVFNNIIYKSKKDNNIDEPNNTNSWVAMTQFAPIDPALFGAVGDGIADDTIPIMTACGFGFVDGMNRTYKIASKIKTNKSFRLKNANLLVDVNADDFSTSEGVIEVTGVVDIDIVTVTETTLKDSPKIKVDDVSKINIGDIIKIKTNEYWDLLGKVYNRYITKVIKIDGDYIYVDKMAPFDININSTIDKIKPIDFVLENVKIKGNVADKNISFVKTKYTNVKVGGVDSSGFGNANLVISNSYKPIIKDSAFYNAILSGYSYGVVLEVCYNPIVKDLSGGDIRHLITVGGTDGITTDIIVDNVVGATREATIDSHSAGKEMIISRSNAQHTIGDDDSSVVFQGESLTISNSNLFSSIKYACLFQPFSKNKANLIITNSNILSIANIALIIETRQDMYINVNNNNINSNNNNAINIKNITPQNVTGSIINNDIKAGSNYKCIFAYNECDFKVNINNNTLTDSDYGVYLQGNSSSNKVSNTIVRDNNIINCNIGIRFYNCNNAKAINNYFENVNNEYIINSDSTNCKKQDLVLADM